MDIERLITLIVKTVVEELARQGLIRGDSISSPKRPVTSDAISPPASEAAPRRRVVSAAMVVNAAQAGDTELEVATDALITPLAQDMAKEKGVTIKRV